MILLLITNRVKGEAKKKTIQALKSISVSGWKRPNNENDFNLSQNQHYNGRLILVSLLHSVCERPS